MSGRYFIALPVSDAARTLCTAFIEELRSAASVRWERQDKFHITLRFLGELKDGGVPVLISALERTLTGQTSFAVTLNSIGAFPSMERPRVLFCAAEKNDPLSALHSEIEQCSISLGFAPEERDYHPHITLGRVNGMRDIDAVREVMKRIHFAPLTFTADRVVLMRSDNEQRSSSYTTLVSVPLR